MEEAQAGAEVEFALDAGEEGDVDGEEVTPTLRRFAALVNAEEGRILQIGSRTPPEIPPEWPRCTI